MADTTAAAPPPIPSTSTVSGHQDSTNSAPSSRGRQRNRRGRGRGGSSAAMGQPPASGQDGAGAENGNRAARGRGSGRSGRTSRGGRGGAAAAAGAQGSNAGAEGAVEAQLGQLSLGSQSQSLPQSQSFSRQHSRQSSRSTSRAPLSADSAQAAAPTQGSAPPRAGRRARFNAALSTSSTSLTPAAPSFAPASAPASVPAPAPVNQTLSSRLTTELTLGTHDCSICFSALLPRESIHSCSTCFTPFHLPCIREWAERSVAETRERAALLATRNGADLSKKEQEGEWRCPSCQTPRPPSSIPRAYQCFCGRQTNPRPPKSATPHSCALPCARPRPEGCTHGSCGALCHPARCEPCAIVVQKQCPSHGLLRGVRCSALHPASGGPLGDEARDALLSCGEVCGKSLGCGVDEHRCQRECHSGECGSCEEVRVKKCYCGREVTEEECGRKEGRERVEGCFRPSNTTEGEEGGWTGEWSCGGVCEVSYDCSHHACKLPCHPHLSPSPPPCPRSPSLVSTCPCSRTPLAALLPAPRTSCEDPIPTCPLPCSKPLSSCDHACQSRCHEGPCPPCSVPINRPCRCGSTTTSALCGEVDHSSEVLCSKPCRALLNCTRHACGRQCCPLAWQEQTKSKGRGGKRVQLDEWRPEEDPLGFHVCQRVCGRKLNCGLHTCQLGDHRGVCPPCLRADFDELVCNCGSTVVLPPIPCNFVIDCRHPCVRPNPCGHPRMPHACHEDPIPCPPCPFLMEKSCACGKKMVANVRCATEVRKVSCGSVCGKLLRCGYHRCKKTCHPAGECEEICTQTCLKPRKPCGHPCSVACHSPTACPSNIPCEKMITVTCSCGHLQQSARCSACDAKPEGNQGRLLKCSDACAAAKRSAQLAEALGVEKREPRRREVEYDPLMMSFYGANAAWCNSIETQLADFVKSDKPSFHFPVMKRPQRAFTHELAELFDLRSESLDEEPRRSVVVHRQSNSGIPTPALADALAAQRKSASTVLTFGSLRKPAQPERKPTNAIFLEGVLGFDEQMLKDILRPLTRGLIFSCSWVGEEDVLVTFDHPSTAELEAKISSMVNSFRTLAEDTGFCATVEPVYLSPEDGKITRGAWTPVATSSRSGSGWRTGAQTPVFTPNAFASLGGAAPSAPAPTRTAWGASGGVVGPAAYKPPRAVVAPVASLERPPPPPHLPSANGASSIPRIPTPPPKVQDEADIPDSWDVEEAEPEQAHPESETAEGTQE